MAGLASAALLAKKGYDVSLVEKNERLGGVANRFEAQGFSFDMGPSWYLMPDVFQNFLSWSASGSRIIWTLCARSLLPHLLPGRRQVRLRERLERDSATFEKLEPGSSVQLAKYLASSKKQYEIALGGFMYRNADSPWTS
jgi:phytoene desaturase